MYYSIVNTGYIKVNTKMDFRKEGMMPSHHSLFFGAKIGNIILENINNNSKITHVNIEDILYSWSTHTFR